MVAESHARLRPVAWKVDLPGTDNYISSTFQVTIIHSIAPIINAIKIIHSLTAQIGSHRYEYSVKLDAGPL